MSRFFIGGRMGTALAAAEAEVLVVMATAVVATVVVEMVGAAVVATSVVAEVVAMVAATAVAAGPAARETVARVAVPVVLLLAAFAEGGLTTGPDRRRPWSSRQPALA